MTPLHIDLTDLRLFLHVVEAGSLTAGAQRGHLALASVSARMSALERTLGAPLLVRSRRGVVPTALGQTLADHARQVLAQADQLREAVQAQATLRAAPLRLLGTSAALREHLPEPLGRFLALHPTVNLHAAEAQSADAVAALHAGEADLAIVPEGTLLHGLAQRRLVADALAFVVPRGHPLVAQAAGRPLPMQALDGWPVVGLVRGSALQDTWEARAAERGTVLRYRVRVASLEAQARLIALGVGVAMMPLAAAQRFARTAAIDVLRLADPFLNRWLLLVCARFEALPPAGQRLLAHLEALTAS